MHQTSDAQMKYIQQLLKIFPDALALWQYFLLNLNNIGSELLKVNDILYDLVHFHFFLTEIDTRVI